MERKVSNVQLILLILSLGAAPLVFSLWIFSAPNQKACASLKDDLLPFYCQGCFYMLLSALAACTLIIYLMKKKTDDEKK